jgi:nitroreductase
MTLFDLVEKNRSRRRFKQDIQIEIEILRELISLARLCPTGANMQPLKYILINTPEKTALVFKHLSWAGYLPNWVGPEYGERPSAYIVILGDTTIRKDFGVDPGIAAQTIMLGAVEKELGGCIIASINKKNLASDLSIPSQFEILLVLALGIPNEEVMITPVDHSRDIKYWRDEKNIHYVPKRSLDELIVEIV